MNIKKSIERLFVECNKCKHKWSAIASNILYHNHGCSMCAGNAKLDISIINEKIKNKLLEATGDYKNANTPITINCLV